MKALENGNFELTEEELKKFLVGYHTNKALEQGGVDNWEWYEESIDNYLQGRNDDIEEFVNYIVDRIE